MIGFAMRTWCDVLLPNGIFVTFPPPCTTRFVQGGWEIGFAGLLEERPRLTPLLHDKSVADRSMGCFAGFFGTVPFTACNGLVLLLELLLRIASVGGTNEEDGCLVTRLPPLAIPFFCVFFPLMTTRGSNIRCKSTAEMSMLGCT